MSQIVLTGLSGASPLGFLAALGLLRLLRRQSNAARLGFLSDGSFCPFVEGPASNLAALVAEDAARAAGRQAWSLEYEKKEQRKGREVVKVVADLKAPPPAFKRFLLACVEEWSRGDNEAVTYGAAFGTDVAIDGNGNTKPTALHFTAANQRFLETVESIRASVTTEWAERSLFEGHAARVGSNLRWDPASERNWALMANNPNNDGTSVDAPAEWLAFRGLPFFPSVPRGSRISTTAVSGRGDHMRMTWPLWSVPISLETARSVLQLTWTGALVEERKRGVFAVCTSAIRRTSQGFGNFGPAAVTA